MTRFLESFLGQNNVCLVQKGSHLKGLSRIVFGSIILNDLGFVRSLSAVELSLVVSRRGSNPGPRLTNKDLSSGLILRRFLTSIQELERDLSGLTGEGFLRDRVDCAQLTVVQAFDRMRPRASSWTADINPVGFYDRWATPLGFCHCPHQG